MIARGERPGRMLSSGTRRVAKRHITNDQSKLKRKPYEKGLKRLQAEPCILQERVKARGVKGIVVLEGRDTAGSTW
jgi:polyphosphate kinase 2 (PPK2 family)